MRVPERLLGILVQLVHIILIIYVYALFCCDLVCAASIVTPKKCIGSYLCYLTNCLKG